MIGPTPNLLYHQLSWFGNPSCYLWIPNNRRSYSHSERPALSGQLHTRLTSTVSSEQDARLHFGGKVRVSKVKRVPRITASRWNHAGNRFAVSLNILCLNCYKNCSQTPKTTNYICIIPTAKSWRLPPRPLQEPSFRHLHQPASALLVGVTFISYVTRQGQSPLLSS